MKNRHSTEQFVVMSRQVSVELGKCKKVPEVCLFSNPITSRNIEAIA